MKNFTTIVSSYVKEQLILAKVCCLFEGGVGAVTGPVTEFGETAGLLTRVGDTAWPVEQLQILLQGLEQRQGLSQELVQC